MKYLQKILAAAVGLGASISAHSLDLAQSRPPASIKDGRLTVGSQHLLLPPGDWAYVAYVPEQVSSPRAGATAAVHTGYAISTSESQFRLGVILSMPASPLQTESWITDLCKGDAFLFKTNLTGTSSEPECLSVTKMTNHLTNTSGLFYPQAQKWMDENAILRPGPTYNILYSRHTRTGHGVTRLFVPASYFRGDQDAIEWAKGLPPLLRPMFERKSQIASLPPLGQTDPNNKRPPEK